MDRLLRVVLQKLIRAGNLQIVTATGSSFTLGDGSDAPATIRIDDRGATPVALVHAPAEPEVARIENKWPWHARGPPPATGPPLFLRDCRLLI